MLNSSQMIGLGPLMNIRPLNGYVLVEIPGREETKTPAGIVVPDSSKQPHPKEVVTCKVLAIDGDKPDEVHYGSPANPGDVVMVQWEDILKFPENSEHRKLGFVYVEEILGLNDAETEN